MMIEGKSGPEGGSGSGGWGWELWTEAASRAAPVVSALRACADISRRRPASLSGEAFVRQCRAPVGWCQVQVSRGHGEFTLGEGRGFKLVLVGSGRRGIRHKLMHQRKLMHPARDAITARACQCSLGMEREASKLLVKCQL